MAPLLHTRRGSSYNGIAELLGETLDDVTRALAESRRLEVIRPDELKFLDLPNCVFMVTVVIGK